MHLKPKHQQYFIRQQKLRTRWRTHREQQPCVSAIKTFNAQRSAIMCQICERTLDWIIVYWVSSSPLLAGRVVIVRRFRPTIKLRAQTRSPAISKNSFGILSLFKILWALLEWLKFCARLRTRERGCCFYWFYEKGLRTHMVVLGILVRFLFGILSMCKLQYFTVHASSRSLSGTRTV